LALPKVLATLAIEMLLFPRISKVEQMATSQPDLAVPITAREAPAQDWLLKRRHEDVSTTFRTGWDLYIKFYTVFLTFSMAAFGLALADKVPKNIIHVALCIA
jgi:hypothetical protein